jgi:hypothetical protein
MVLTNGTDGTNELLGRLRDINVYRSEKTEWKT